MQTITTHPNNTTHHHYTDPDGYWIEILNPEASSAFGNT